MKMQWLIGACLIGLTVVLSGCGGGGGPDPAPGPAPGPTPPAGPTAAPIPPAGDFDCASSPYTKSRNFVHCSKCHSDGSAISCKECSKPYTPNPAATHLKDADQVCITKCGDIGPRPSKPANAQGNNGVVWPTFCADDAHEAVWFGIGDWGGMCGFNGAECVEGVVNKDCQFKYKEHAKPGEPCLFNLPGRIQHAELEGDMQQRIGGLMSKRNDALKQAGAPPQFIVNAGDNFYPGGVDVHCGNNDVEQHIKNQFEYVWHRVYKGELTERMEWWGVLGNHDYGGVCYVKGWDQQVLYTYDSPDSHWITPGQFWMRSVQYKNMKMDFYFIDGSWYDTKSGGGGLDKRHNICQYGQDNTGKYCENKYYPGPGATCPGTGPYNGGDCENWFTTLWSAQYKWLMDKVPNSVADWQIVVTHYPGSSALGHAGLDRVDWREWGPKMGLDLIISGHKHYQRIFKGGLQENIELWDKGTVSVVLGGGGGITSDNPGPLSLDGNDDAYGFMEFHATLEEIKITAYSHGGLQGNLIVRNSTSVLPVLKKSDDEIIKAGLDPQNLLQKREITV